MKLFLRIVVVLCFIIVLTSVCYLHYSKKHKLNSSEKLAYLHLRVIASELKVDGNISKEFTSEEMSSLEKAAKRINPKIDWFSSNSGTFYTQIADTSKHEVIWISDGKYYATFYITKGKDPTTKIIHNCTFSTEKEKGYEFLVKW